MSSSIENIFIPSLVILGIILNLLTIMVFCRNRMRKFCFSLFMICLAISDTCVLTIPVLINWIDETFFKFYYLNNTIWCNLHGYVDLVFCAYSSWIIVLISTERWFAVCKPWQKSRVFTNTRVVVTLLCLFAFSLLMFIFFPISIHREIIEEGSLYTCDVLYKKIYKFFGIFSILLVYVFPFFILAFLNIMIILRLRLRPFKIKSINLKKNKDKRLSTFSLKNNEINNDKSNNTSNSNTNSKINIRDTKIELTNSNNLATTCSALNNTQSNQLANSKNDRNLNITLVTVAITFMILTFPFQANWFYNEFIQKEPSNQSSYVQSSIEDDNNTSIYYLSNITVTNSINSWNWHKITFNIKNMNYVINFILYSALSKLFREEFLALLSGDNFFLLRKFVLCMFQERKKSKKKENPMAELSISLGRLSNKSKGKKYIKIRIEPSNIMKYIEMKNSKSKNKKLFDHETKVKTILVVQDSIQALNNDDHINKNEDSPCSSNKVSSATQTVKTTFKRYKK